VCAGCRRQDERLETMSKALSRLPPAHYNTLRHLLRHLYKLVYKKLPHYVAESTASNVYYTSECGGTESTASNVYYTSECGGIMWLSPLLAMCTTLVNVGALCG
jgi:hypothetical protein